MKLRLLTFLIATALVGSGCVINNTGNGGYANVTFAWTFAGATCADTTVSYVVITIPGETLENNGQYDCNNSGADGITVNNFVPGTYPYTIDAYDSSNTLLFTASSQFTVNGVGLTIPVDLAPVGGANSYDLVSWTFANAANAPACGGEITQVVVSVDGQAAPPYDCAAGMSGGGVATPYVAAGTHTLQIDAEDGTGYVYASRQATITTVTGQPTSQSFELPWVVGSAAFSYTFYDSTGNNPTTSCSATGVQTLAANFQDSAGNWLYVDGQGNVQDDVFNCSDASNVSLYRALPAGDYTIFLEGDGAAGSGIVFAESPGQASYPVTVQAGVFYTTPVPSNVLVPIKLQQQ